MKSPKPIAPVLLCCLGITLTVLTVSLAAGALRFRAGLRALESGCEALAKTEVPSLAYLEALREEAGTLPARRGAPPEIDAAGISGRIRSLLAEAGLRPERFRIGGKDIEFSLHADPLDFLGFLQEFSSGKFAVVSYLGLKSGGDGKRWEITVKIKLG